MRLTDLGNLLGMSYMSPGVEKLPNRWLHLPPKTVSGYDVGVITPMKNLPYEIKASFLEGLIKGSPPLIIYIPISNGDDTFKLNAYIKLHDGTTIFVSLKEHYIVGNNINDKLGEPSQNEILGAIRVSKEVGDVRYLLGEGNGANNPDHRKQIEITKKIEEMLLKKL